MPKCPICQPDLPGEDIKVCESCRKVLMPDYVELKETLQDLLIKAISLNYVNKLLKAS